MNYRQTKNSPISIYLLILFVVGFIGLGLTVFAYIIVRERTGEIPSSPDLIEQVIQDDLFQPDLELSGLLQKTYSYEYGCQKFSFDLPIYSSVYNYYSTEDKLLRFRTSSSLDRESQYYLQFVQSQQDDEAIQLIINTIKNQLNTNNSDDLAIALTSFVQNIEYDCNKLYSYTNLDDHDYETNYPYETLYLKSGVCGDFSILLGEILEDLGYGVVFLIFDQANHMSVGIRCPVENANYSLNGKGYCYIETTGPARIGIIPDSLSETPGSESPKIVEVSDGKSFGKINELSRSRKNDVNIYGDYILQFSTCEEILRYQVIYDQELVLVDFEDRLAELELEIEPVSTRIDSQIEQYTAMGCEGSLEQEKYETCLTKFNELESSQLEFESMVNDFNSLAGEYNVLYEKYVLEIDAFDTMIDKNYPQCSVISVDPGPLYEKSGD